MVKAIQDQSVVVRNDLYEVADASMKGVEKAKITATALEGVERDMGTVIDGNRQIQQAAEEAAAAVVQAKKGIEQIAAAAEEASTATAEASAAAKQQSQGAEELASAIEEIASIADELQSG